MLWIGMGDLIECAVAGSVGAGIFEQIQSPKEQIDDMVAHLRPIASLCIGLLKGNHEERAHKLTGIDPMAIIADRLDVPYCEWEFWGVIARVPHPDRAWSVYAVHSSTANKSTGLALAWTDREMRKWADVDITMRGHSHDLGYDSAQSLELSMVGINPSVRERQRVSVSTGHYLRRAGSYAAAKAMAPKSPGAIALELSMHRDSVSKVKPLWLP